MKDFLIYSWAFNNGSGGKMLHKLCHLLNENGYRAFLYQENFLHTGDLIGTVSGYYNTPLATRLMVDNIDNFIVVYPEIIKGNPLGAKHVVRWILNSADEEIFYKTYGKNDIIFYYSNLYYSKYLKNYNNILTIIEFHKDVFINKNLDRPNTCFSVRKCKNPKFIHPHDSIMISWDDAGYYDKLVNIFNTSKYFYCYDNMSHLVIQAAMCGCIPIIIPNNYSKEQMLSNSIGFNGYGIAYGNTIDEIEHAIKTRPLLLEKIDNYIDSEKSGEHIHNFVNICEKKMNKKIVYITGCLGFIGSYITRECLERGWYVMGIDKATYAANTSLISEFYKYDNFSFDEIDINDLKFLYDCDYVINCAAETHVGNSITNSDEFIRSNINGVHHLLELLRNYRQETGNTPIFLHFSTDEVYGDITTGIHTEKDLLRPSNPYSATKAAADMLILAWARTYNIQYIIVRPTNNYGVGQYVEKLIPKSCKYLNLGRKIPLHNNGTPIRNWLHVSDTSNAVMTIIESNTINEIYNICGGFEQSNLETVKKIIKLDKQDGDYEKYIDFSIVRAGQDVRYSLDDSKLRSLGWKPMCNFDDELSEIIKYYKETFIW